MTDIRARIAEEYNIIHAWIALHPYAAVTVFFAVGVGCGWVFL